MCGRYALALSNEEVYDALQNQLPQIFQGGVGGGGGGSVGRPRWERQQDYRPKWVTCDMGLADRGYESD